MSNSRPNSESTEGREDLVPSHETVLESKQVVASEASQTEANASRVSREVSSASATDVDTPEVTRIELVAPEGDLTGTWIEGQQVLEQVSSETSLRITRSHRPQLSVSSVSSVVLRTREVARIATRQRSDVDYEISFQLGEGGMGAVYRARQGALDRSVALKVIKPSLVDQNGLKEKFMAEAVITGDLEHPGIVPIYDLGLNSAGEVFYAMKEVKGASWKQLLEQYSEAENIEVLLRVADAIAFAHDRGVLHRDLKPENVMIGEFGEVLVMDWGLALPLSRFAKPGIPYAAGPAGTPRYMSPELATGDMDRIGPPSDIYLLGAILFQILTGKAPHPGRHALSCLQAAERNEIIAVERSDELMQIAYRALHSDPDQRYASVKDFQAAIREYRVHAESHRLVEHGFHELQAAETHGEYRAFERACAAFEDALTLWPGNERARSELSVGRRAYASAAFQRGDFDLAVQQLNAHDPTHAAFAEQVRAAQVERDSRVLRLRRLKRIAIGLVAMVLVIVSVSSLMIYRSWRAEQVAHDEALQRFRESHQAIQRLTAASRELEFLPRMQAVRTNLLQTVARYYHELQEKRSSDAGMKLEQAIALIQLGDVNALLGDLNAARSTYAAAREAAASVATSAARADVVQESKLLRSRAALKLAQCQIQQRQLSEAEESLNESLHWASTGSSSDQQTQQADIVFQRARLLGERGEFAPARSELQKAAQLYEHAARDAKGERLERCQLGLASTCDLAAQLAERAGHLAEAEQAASRAIAVWEGLVELAPDVPTHLDGLAQSHVLLGNILRGFGRDALPHARGAIKAYAALSAARPEVPRYRFNLATEEANLADLLWRDGELAAAKEQAVAAVNGCIRLSNEFPEELDFADGEASARSVLGEVLRDQGEFGLAAEVFQEAHQHFADRAQQFREVSSYHEREIENLSLHAQVVFLGGKTQDARLELERALARAEQRLKTDPTAPRARELAAWLHQHLAEVAAVQNDHDAVTTHWQAMITLRESLPRTPQRLHDFGWALASGASPETRQPQRAVELLTSATDLAPAVSDYWIALAVAHVHAEQLAAATTSVRRAKETEKQPSGAVELVEALIARHEQRVEAAEALLKRGQQLMAERCPGRPRLRRLRELLDATAE